jgi:hypothetical protein
MIMKTRRPSDPAQIPEVLGDPGLDEQAFTRSMLEYARYSIKRNGSNEDYELQDLPYATYPSRAGVLYRAGTDVGGRRCPRCPTFIAVHSPVVRLYRPEEGKWWVHRNCWTEALVDCVDCGDAA